MLHLLLTVFHISMQGAYFMIFLHFLEIIGNMESFIPFDKIVSFRRVSTPCALISGQLVPHRGFMSNPSDGVGIVTTMISEPWWLWPRSAGKPERCPGCCPKLTIVFSPVGGSLNFIREVENEMRHFSGSSENIARFGHGRLQPPSYPTAPQQQSAPVLWMDQENPAGKMASGGGMRNSPGRTNTNNVNKASLDLFDV